MIKLIIKLAIVALVANAVLHLMTAYVAYYKFTDAVQQTTQFGSDKSLDAIRTRVAQLAAEYEIPVGEDDFSVTRQELHTIVDGSYNRPVELFPGYKRAWKFTFHIDTFTEGSPSDR